MAKKHPFDNRKRSFVKSITFRILIVIADTTIVLALTKRYDLAIGFVVLTNLASTLLYYLHERVWAHIHWGKVKKS
jgi:uncharacterized membrane protein